MGEGTPAFKKGSKRSGDKYMLFSLDMEDFAAGVGRLMGCGIAALSFANGLAYMSNENGSGFFDKYAAAYGVVHIRNCINNPDKYGMPTGTWKRSDDWLDLIDKAGVLNTSITKPYKYTGTLYNSIGVIYRGKHSRTIGIRRSIKVKRSVFPQSTAGTIPVATIAKILEWGLSPRKGKMSGIAPRLLFTYGIRSFAQKEFPSLVDTIDKAMKKSIEIGQTDLTRLEDAEYAKAVAFKHCGKDYKRGGRTISQLGHEVKQNKGFQIKTGRELEGSRNKQMTDREYLNKYGAEALKALKEFEQTKRGTENYNEIIEEMRKVID